MKRFLTLLFTVAVVILCSSCRHDAKEALVIGMVPSTSPEVLKDHFEEIRKYLEKEMSMPIRLYVPDDYAELIHAMKESKVDIGLYGAFSYIIADTQQDLEPLVVRKRKDMGVTYNSLIITAKDSPIETIEDLRDRRMAFVNAASTSGYAIPYALFVSRGVDIDSFLGEYYFAGSHDLVAQEVLEGRAQAGAISKSILRGLALDNDIDMNDLKIIWESDPIPGSPFIARKDVSDRIKNGFREAMLALHEKAPEALTAYSSSLERYVPIEKGMYNSIRNIVNVLGEEFIIENYLSN